MIININKINIFPFQTIDTPHNQQTYRKNARLVKKHNHSTPKKYKEKQIQDNEEDVQYFADRNYFIQTHKIITKYNITNNKQPAKTTNQNLTQSQYINSLKNQNNTIHRNPPEKVFNIKQLNNFMHSPNKSTQLPFQQRRNRKYSSYSQLKISNSTSKPKDKIQSKPQNPLKLIISQSKQMNELDQSFIIRTSRKSGRIQNQHKYKTLASSIHRLNKSSISQYSIIKPQQIKSISLTERISTKDFEKSIQKSQRINEHLQLDFKKKDRELKQLASLQFYNEIFRKRQATDRLKKIYSSFTKRGRSIFEQKIQKNQVQPWQVEINGNSTQIL